MIRAACGQGLTSRISRLKTVSPCTGQGKERGRLDSGFPAATKNPNEPPNDQSRAEAIENPSRLIGPAGKKNPGG
jgi:hypothetical protein